MARMWLFLITVPMFMYWVIYEGRQVYNYLIWIQLIFISYIVFPRSEKNIMKGISLLCLILLIASMLINQYLEPLVYYDEAQISFNNQMTMLTFMGLATLWVIALRYLVDNTEIRLQSEKQKLVDANEKINSLSEKLKVYLPRQFVESLASGDRETEPDYRRRRLTIFFSDVEGFTKWTDKLEPEEVREILNHYLSEMSAIAHKHGGTIDKFIGDCLMIFFGDPEYTNDKDHALRCVKMAMEMQGRMEDLRNEWRGMAYDEPLRIRMGINTGWATVGNFGSEDRLNYTALGSAVNLASRLEAACAPDKITVSHTTYLLIKDEIDCEPRGELEAKGISEPVKIYEVEEIKS